MKIVKIKSTRMFALAVAMVGVIVGCGSDDPTMTRGSGPIVSAQNTPTPEIRRSDDGNTHVRTDGWPVPSFGEAERKEFETSIPTADGRSVKVYRTVIRTEKLLIMDNPLSLIGWAPGKININTVMEYRTAAGVFCYKFLVMQR